MKSIDQKKGFVKRASFFTTEFTACRVVVRRTKTEGHRVFLGGRTKEQRLWVSAFSPLPWRPFDKLKVLSEAVGEGNLRGGGTMLIVNCLLGTWVMSLGTLAIGQPERLRKGEFL